MSIFPENFSTNLNYDDDDGEIDGDYDNVFNLAQTNSEMLSVPMGQYGYQAKLDELESKIIELKTFITNNLNDPNVYLHYNNLRTFADEYIQICRLMNTQDHHTYIKNLQAMMQQLFSMLPQDNQTRTVFEQLPKVTSEFIYKKFQKQQNFDELNELVPMGTEIIKGLDRNFNSYTDRRLPSVTRKIQQEAHTKEQKVFSTAQQLFVLTHNLRDKQVLVSDLEKLKRNIDINIEDFIREYITEKYHLQKPANPKENDSETIIKYILSINYNFNNLHIPVSDLTLSISTFRIVKGIRLLFGTQLEFDIIKDLNSFITLCRYVINFEQIFAIYINILNVTNNFNNLNVMPDHLFEYLTSFVEPNLMKHFRDLFVDMLNSTYIRHQNPSPAEIQLARVNPTFSFDARIKQPEFFNPSLPVFDEETTKFHVADFMNFICKFHYKYETLSERLRMLRSEEMSAMAQHDMEESSRKFTDEELSLYRVNHSKTKLTSVRQLKKSNAPQLVKTVITPDAQRLREINPNISDRMIDITLQLNQLKFNKMTRFNIENFNDALVVSGVLFKIMLPFIIKFLEALNYKLSKVFSAKTRHVYVEAYANILFSIFCDPRLKYNMMDKFTNSYTLINELVYFANKPYKKGILYPRDNLRKYLNDSFRPTDNQIESLRILYEHFLRTNITVIHANTGFGKTTLCLWLSTYFIRENHHDDKVVIILKHSNIVVQWIEQLKKLRLNEKFKWFMWSKKDSIAEWSEGHLKTHDERMNAIKRSNFVVIFANRTADIGIIRCKLLIIDECHKFINATAGAAYNHIFTDNIILCSATPGKFIHSYLGDYIAPIQHLALYDKPYILELFNTNSYILCDSGDKGDIRDHAYRVQMLYCNVYYVNIIVMRLKEYFEEYQKDNGRRPKIMMFCNIIVHARLLNRLLEETTDITSTLYIQDDEVCDGNADIMIVTYQKGSTGFDQSNSKIAFNREFDTIFISMNIAKFDLYTQMIGRLRNKDPNVRIVFCLNEMIVNGDNFPKLLTQIRLNQHVRQEVRYSPYGIEVNYTPFINPKTGYVTHSIMPVKIKKDNINTVDLKSEEILPCNSTNYTHLLNYIKCKLACVDGSTFEEMFKTYPDNHRVYLNIKPDENNIIKYRENEYSNYIQFTMDPVPCRNREFENTVGCFAVCQCANDIPGFKCNNTTCLARLRIVYQYFINIRYCTRIIRDDRGDFLPINFNDLMIIMNNSMYSRNKHKDAVDITRENYRSYAFNQSQLTTCLHNIVTIDNNDDDEEDLLEVQGEDDLFDNINTSREVTTVPVQQSKPITGGNKLLSILGKIKNTVATERDQLRTQANEIINGPQNDFDF